VSSVSRAETRAAGDRRCMMAQAVYNVIGTTTSGPLYALETESYEMNVCAMNKAHAAELASRRLKSDGYRGTVVATIERLPGGCGMYELTDTLRIR